MCGLVAVLNKYSNGNTSEQNEVFSNLLFLDMLRGDDSTGVILVDNQGDVDIAKEASNSLDFMRSKEYEALMRKAFSRGSALIGHNRKATRGIINDENAHPFIVEDNIILIHNGTLFGDHKKHADTEVDSHAIAHVLQKTGDVEKALNSIDGAYALIWYNVEAGEINIIRNKQRPLWWMETPSSYIFSSEKSMLDFVATRKMLNLKEAPVELPEDLLQTFRLAKGGGWSSDSKELKISPKVVYSGSSSGGNWQFGQWTGGQGNNTHNPHRRNRFYEDVACAWEDGEGGSCNMEDSFPRKNNRNIPNIANARHSMESIHGMERSMMKKMNKGTKNRDYHSSILNGYHHGMKVVCEPFDYIEAPFKDGYYLYSSIVNDPDVVVKHFWGKQHCSEERVIQMASADYVYEMVVDKIEWIPFVERNLGNGPFIPFKEDDMGGVILTTNGRAELIYGGGVGSKDEISKRITQLH